MKRLRNLYRLTFHPSRQWQSVSLWQRWNFVLSGALVPPGTYFNGRREDVRVWTDAYLGEIVGRHDLCGGRLHLRDDGTTYCFKCDTTVEEL